MSFSLSRYTPRLSGDGGCTATVLASGESVWGRAQKYGFPVGMNPFIFMQCVSAANKNRSADLKTKGMLSIHERQADRFCQGLPFSLDEDVPFLQPAAVLPQAFHLPVVSSL